MTDPFDPLLRQLDLLLSGYGFNYYKAENQLRADDLLIRQKVGAALGNAAARLEELASEFQRRWMPAPSREQPYPPAELMNRLKDARALRQRLLDLEMQIQGAAAPAQDKIWRRLRLEKGLLETLLQADIHLLQLAAEVERTVSLLAAEQWKSAGVENAVIAAANRLNDASNARRELLEVQPNR